ncbi:MAG TPA: UbiA family prenyltransferase [Chloroflexota bacterium]|nr:UbiA family prenyltransferase [Chloroflexota bacterium]
MGQGTSFPKETAARAAWAWFRLLHPFPSALVTGSSFLFAELATGGRADPWVLARLVLSVACSQGAIGAANDVVDRDLDAATKPWKPVARGVISRKAAAILAGVLSLLCLALSASLPLPTVLAALVGLGCGLAYDLKLKRSRWSWLPYGLAIPTLPVWAWAATGKLSGRLAPAYPLGLLLGLAIHLANTLPDLEGDRGFGVGGFAHGLGRRRGLRLCWAALGLAQCLTVALAPVIHYRGWAYPVGLGASVALLLVAMVGYRVRPTSGTLQFNFGVIALASLALAAGWLAGAVA